MKKIVKTGVILIIIAVIVFIAVSRLLEIRKRNAELATAKIYPIVVKEISPKITDVKLTLPYLAEVANDKDVKLTSRISARILKIMPSGSKVHKGEIVVKLDITNIQSSLKSVKNQMQATKIALKNLKATHKRTLELLAVQGASIEESQKEATLIAKTDAALNALAQKEIELKNNLSYATIISPVDGVIAKTFSNKGALSLPGHPLVAIASKNGFYLMLRVPTDLSIKGVEFEGKTYEVTALGSTFHGLAEYKVYTGNAKLINGDRVEVSVIILHQKDVLLPFNALLNRNSKSYVLVVEGNKAVPLEIHVIQSAQEGVVVSESLQGKNIVIAKPDILLKLVSGYALKVKE